MAETETGQDTTALPGVAPPQSVNRGRHIIHTGGPYDSHLTVPFIPGCIVEVRS